MDANDDQSLPPLPPSLNTTHKSHSPGSGGGDGFHAYGLESEQQYLSDLAYKAKFAEEISNHMRVPKRIAIDEDATDDYRHDPLDDMMKVPSKITFNREDSAMSERRRRHDSPDPLFSPAHRATNEISEASDNLVQLQTPPRTLGVLDRMDENGTPRGVLSEALTSNDMLNRMNSQVTPVTNLTTQQYQSIPALDMDALNDLLAEEPTSAVIRQQLHSLYRRVTSLEKKEAQRLATETSQSRMMYAMSGLALLSLCLSVITYRKGNYY